jgi:hypothetical protein
MMVEQTPLEKILFNKPKWLWVLLDGCGIDRDEEWVKSLEIKYHDFGDDPQEIINKDDLIMIMVHCQNNDLKDKLRGIIGVI